MPTLTVEREGRCSWSLLSDESSREPIFFQITLQHLRSDTPALVFSGKRPNSSSSTSTTTTTLARSAGAGGGGGSHYQTWAPDQSYASYHAYYYTTHSTFTLERLLPMSDAAPVTGPVLVGGNSNNGASTSLNMQLEGVPFDAKTTSYHILAAFLRLSPVLFCTSAAKRLMQATAPRPQAPGAAATSTTTSRPKLNINT